MRAGVDSGRGCLSLVSARMTRKTLLLAALGLLTLLGAALTARAETAARSPVFAERQLAYLIEVPSSTPDVLIADAESSALLRFSHSEEGLVSRDTRYMSVGQNGMGKQRAWDRKTPLGIYFITEELDTSKLADKYGVAAFVLDYPNAWDLYKERTGYGIWLHGVDPNAPDRPPRDTDGCLALPNGEIAALGPELRPNLTPVIIARKLDWVDGSEVEALRVDFRAVLEAWRASLEAGDLIAHLALYDEAFAARGLDKPELASFKLGAFEARELDDVVLTDVLLLRDPEEPDLFLSRFTQTLVTAAGQVTTRKRLYWRRSDDQWSIVSEDAG